MRAIDGVASAEINFAAGILEVGFEPGRDARDKVEARVREAGHGLEPADAGAGDAAQREPESWLRRYRHEIALAVAAALIAVGYASALVSAPWGETAGTVAFALAVVAGGSLTARRAVSSLRARSLDMNVLMSLAAIGAAAIGAWEEAASIVFLFSIGQYLESRALERTRRSVRDLMALTPARARVRRHGADALVPPEDVAVGETIVVKPGERVPLDGRVTGGASAVDEAAITGESVPAEKEPGDAVFAGTLNTSGLLEIEVTSLSGDSTLARVVRLVEEAQGQRAPLERLVDRFSRYYTPIVVSLAAAVAIVPPVLAALLGQDWGAPSEWFYRALVLLVVSCPCALVISTPVAIVSAITRAARDGVLVKGGAFLEVAPTIAVIAFDKTGTLTCGRPEVSDVLPLRDGDASRVLRLAAALEMGSTHPVAEAILRAENEAAPVGITDFRDVAGRGVRAVVDGVTYALGSPLMAEQECRLDEHAAVEVARLEEEGKTVLVLSRCDSDPATVGLIAVADQVRPESASVVAALRRGGIAHVVMLTGDNERTAEAVARHAGITEWRSRLLPADKLEAVRELRERYGPVAMVGDGVNDAPALALADIGIAMGAAGSDTALETADVALMAPDTLALSGLFDLGRRTVANVHFNVGFSIVTKLAVLVLAVFGYASLWLAVFADMGVSLLVTANGLRLLRRRRG